MAIDPLWLQNLDYPARIDRAVFDVLWTEGVVDSGDFEVTQSTPTAMSVDVAVGAAVVTGDDQSYQGKYLVRTEVTDTLSIAAAPGTGDRHDLVVLRVRDSNAGVGVDDDAILEVVTGTPGSPAVDPPLPDTALLLARVRVPATTSTITNALIDDLRVRATSNYDVVPDGGVTSAKIANGAIMDVDISGSAAIGLSKLGSGTLPSSVAVTRSNFANSYIPGEAVFTIPGTLSVGARDIRYYCEQNRTIANVVASVGTAPTGASAIFDVKKNGVSIYANPADRPTIAASSFYDGSSVPSTTGVAAGDYLTVSVEQIGSTVIGSDAVIKVVFA